MRILRYLLTFKTDRAYALRDRLRLRDRAYALRDRTKGAERFIGPSARIAGYPFSDKVTVCLVNPKQKNYVKNQIRGSFSSVSWQDLQTL